MPSSSYIKNSRNWEDFLINMFLVKLTFQGHIFLANHQAKDKSLTFSAFFFHILDLVLFYPHPTSHCKKQCMSGMDSICLDNCHSPTKILNYWIATQQYLPTHAVLSLNLLLVWFQVTFPLFPLMLPSLLPILLLILELSKETFII